MSSVNTDNVVNLMNRIADLEAVIEQQAKTYEQFQEACYERDRYKDAWARGNDLIEAMEEVKNKQLARIAELEAALRDYEIAGGEYDATRRRVTDLEAENERLLDLSDDTKRLEFIIKNYMRVYSLDMSGKHTWSGVGRPIGKGTTPREAIDAAMEGK